MAVRFKSPTHARIFVILMTTLGVGTYFSPTLYRAFIMPKKHLEKKSFDNLNAVTSSHDQKEEKTA